MKTTATKKMVTVLAALVLVTVSAGIVCAGPSATVASETSDDPLTKWKTTGSCYNCDLTGLTLPIPDAIAPDRVNGKTKTLENAILKNVVIEADVDLSDYNLKNAKFYSATFKGTKLNNAKVTQASFQDAVFERKTKNKDNTKADLSGITSDTDQSIDFSGSDLDGAVKPVNFPNNANLKNAKFTKTITCEVDSTQGYCKNKNKCKEAPHKVNHDLSCN